MKLQSLNYDKYCLGIREWAELFLKAMALTLLIGYLFYDSVWVCIVFVPILIGFWKREQRRKIILRKNHLGGQFKDAIILLYSFIAAGSTLEGAFEKAAADLTLTYSTRDDIVREFREICRKLSMNIRLEDCLEDFARRSGHEDIKDFSQVIVLAKRGGGSMTMIIKNSVDAIRNKQEIESEIITMMAGKRNEFRLMVFIPAAVLLYMRLFSPGFMDVLYIDTAGRLLMSMCLGVYGAAVLWGKKVLDIRV